MKITKKLLSMLLALVLVLGLLPATVFATGAEDVVYLSISYDSNYIDDKTAIPSLMFLYPWMPSLPLIWQNTAWTICSMMPTATVCTKQLPCSC